MQERVDQVSSSDTEVIATNGTSSSESAIREPFRAKFRTGTPRRNSDPVVTGMDSSSQGKSPRNHSSSALPPLEIEVTGLRPIKRHAPAFFGDKQGVNQRDASEEKSYRGGNLPTFAPDHQPAKSFHTRASIAGGDIVPHFTDEEFDDWGKSSDSRPIRDQQNLVKARPNRGMRTCGSQSQRTNHPTSAAHPERHSAKFNHERLECLVEQSGDRVACEGRKNPQSERLGRSPRNYESHHSTPAGRLGDRTRGHRAPERGTNNRSSFEDARPRGAGDVQFSSPSRLHPRNISRGNEPRFSSRETERPNRSSRNSSELVDTTAERLYGKGASLGGTQPSREWSSRVSRPSRENGYPRPNRKVRFEK